MSARQTRACGCLAWTVSFGVERRVADVRAAETARRECEEGALLYGMYRQDQPLFSLCDWGLPRRAWSGAGAGPTPLWGKRGGVRQDRAQASSAAGVWSVSVMRSPTLPTRIEVQYQSVSQLFHGPAPRSPLYRLAVRLRHSRSNTSTEYSLLGATQLSQVRSITILYYLSALASGADGTMYSMGCLRFCKAGKERVRR